MATTQKSHRRKLPAGFAALVRMMPPQAIADVADCEGAREVIDRLMAAGRLTKGQESYLKTLVCLVEAYEREQETIETADLTGLDMLRHLLSENGMNASDLARLLGVHASMGSKILNGERSLTVAHLRKLGVRFKVSPEMFM
jgi:HTH-type transcriptional regulator/antitoxin HigA